MNASLYFQIGFFFSLFIKLIHDFLPGPKDMKGIELNNPTDYSIWHLILLCILWPLYVVFFLLNLIKNMIEIRNKKK